MTLPGGAGGAAMLAAVLAGGAEGLVLVRDSTVCEGRSLLRAFAMAAVRRGECVLVVPFDVSPEQFGARLSPDIGAQLLYWDGFSDPLGWSGGGPGIRAGDFVGQGGPGRLPEGPLTLLLDSLSWLLLRLPPPRLCQALQALLRPPRGTGPATRVVALLHGDLHSPGLLAALMAQAGAVVALGPVPPLPGGPRHATVLSRSRGGVLNAKDEYFCLLPDCSLQVLGEVPGSPLPGARRGGGLPPPQALLSPLTFNLRLSAAERAARAAVPPPYAFSTHKQSALLQMPGTLSAAPEEPDTPDPEDPDDDLDV
ncbi:elongator complex protein 5 [Rhea pennata]|uniref:elongator complex protein 5 n=1 Tax=Rhea pennata TaxID=8795 RepID=UPI002E2766EA